MSVTATTDCRTQGSRHRRAVSKKRTGDGGVCQQTLIFLTFRFSKSGAMQTRKTAFAA